MGCFALLCYTKGSFLDRCPTRGTRQDHKAEDAWVALLCYTKGSFLDGGPARGTRQDHKVEDAWVALLCFATRKVAFLTSPRAGHLSRSQGGACLGCFALLGFALACFATRKGNFLDGCPARDTRQDHKVEDAWVALLWFASLRER